MAESNYEIALIAKIRVMSSDTPSPTSTVTPAHTPVPTIVRTPESEQTPGYGRPKTASVEIYGEKTDVELGDDILLRLSAVNYITKPKMTVQVIIIPSSGMSVVSTEFTKTQAGQYATNYELQPGDGKDIEVKIVPNQIGDFKVKGKIVYYFGNDKENGEYHDLDLDVRVREKRGGMMTGGMMTPLPVTTPLPTKAPGFEIIIGMIGVLFVVYLRRKIYNR